MAVHMYNPNAGECDTETGGQPNWKTNREWFCERPFSRQKGEAGGDNITQDTHSPESQAYNISSV